MVVTVLPKLNYNVLLHQVFSLIKNIIVLAQMRTSTCLTVSFKASQYDLMLLFIKDFRVTRLTRKKINKCKLFVCRLQSFAELLGIQYMLLFNLETLPTGATSACYSILHALWRFPLEKETFLRKLTRPLRSFLAANLPLNNKKHESQQHHDKQRHKVCVCVGGKDQVGRAVRF